MEYIERKKGKSIDHDTEVARGKPCRELNDDTRSYVILLVTRKTMRQKTMRQGKRKVVSQFLYIEARFFCQF
jgi:hypothetical protein